MRLMVFSVLLSFLFSNPKESIFDILGTKITIKSYVFKKTPVVPVVFFALHENEKPTFYFAKEIIKEKGGTIFQFTSQGKREFTINDGTRKYRIDPNGIFTQKGITYKLHWVNGYTSKDIEGKLLAFSKRILNLHSLEDSVIVGLHNNTIGSYSIDSYKKEPKYISSMKDIFINSNLSLDDFFIVTDLNDFNYFKSRKFNVVLQDNVFAVDDGSLSVYCGKNKIRYINIETEYSSKTQKEMILAVYSLVEAQFLAVKFPN